MNGGPEELGRRRKKVSLGLQFDGIAFRIEPVAGKRVSGFLKGRMN